MFDLLKQSIFATIGVAALTREKVTELAAEVAARSKLTEQQAAEFEADLSSRADKARQELEAEIDRRIDHAFIQLGIIKAGLKRNIEAVDSSSRATIDDAIERVIDRLGVARADDLKALSIRLDALEARVNKP
ncbi:hypothetical protein V5E97_12670 [Singulisphaera sp. Ch08]|uniref:Phasin family protein n=1 Tax=Singulisphaera sp. Ch08 TaxID=3120278 RepID=A0AAU7CP35_9BACT